MKKLLICHLIIAILYLTWLIPPFSAAWQWIDVKAYPLLASLLTPNPTIRGFWAICNSPWIDWFHDIIIASFLIYYIFKGPKLKRLANVLTAILFAALIITVVNRVHPTRVQRKSPTKVYKWTAPRLSKEVTWVKVKDKSSASFPSDHAVTALLFVGIIFILMGPRMGLLASYYGIFFILPRLVVGAHWLSDIFVGSASIALFALSWFYGTPLAQRISYMIERGFTLAKIED